MARNRYNVTLRRERFRPLPKKFLQWRRLPIRDGYSATASLWVPDRPEGNLSPAVTLTLKHGDDGIRFCFQNAADPIIFGENLREFIAEYALPLHEAHTRALEEFHAYHKDHQLPPINDSTDYTVLQGLVKTENGLVDLRTGEILGDGGNDSPDG